MHELVEYLYVILSTSLCEFDYVSQKYVSQKPLSIGNVLCEFDYVSQKPLSI